MLIERYLLTFRTQKLNSNFFCRGGIKHGPKNVPSGREKAEGHSK